jgi:predicted transcriptional regulator of viral defense system
VYRLTRFPAAENEDLVVLWLWSGGEGVFSHETALSLHQLSDALPFRYHLTVPMAWRARRRRTPLPRNLVLHHADLPDADRTWNGPVPITTALRTIHDLVDAHADPAIVQQAAREGIARALFREQQVHGLLPPRRGRPPGTATERARRRKKS